MAPEACFKTSGAPKMLQNISEKFNGISQAFIYGSFAKGDEREDSYIDFSHIEAFLFRAHKDIIAARANWDAFIFA